MTGSNQLRLPDLSDIQTTRRRRARSVRNSLIDLDDVVCAPGPSFVNWIAITKTKLLQREKELLIRRIDTVKKTVMDTIEQFNQEHLGKKNIRSVDNLDSLLSQINMGDFIVPCTRDLQQELHQWEGTKSKQAADFTMYRQYFRKCKNWFDQKKLPILAASFWIPILSKLKSFVYRHSLRYGVEHRELVRRYLQRLLMLRLLESTFKVPACRERIVIGVGLYAQRFTLVSELEIQGIERQIHQMEPKVLSCTEIRNLVVRTLKSSLSNSLPLIHSLPPFGAQSVDEPVALPPEIHSGSDLHINPIQSTSTSLITESPISTALHPMPPVVDPTNPTNPTNPQISSQLTPYHTSIPHLPSISNLPSIHSMPWVPPIVPLSAIPLDPFNPLAPSTTPCDYGTTHLHDHHHRVQYEPCRQQTDVPHGNILGTAYQSTEPCFMPHDSYHDGDHRLRPLPVDSMCFVSSPISPSSSGCAHSTVHGQEYGASHCSRCTHSFQRCHCDRAPHRSLHHNCYDGPPLSLQSMMGYPGSNTIQSTNVHRAHSSSIGRVADARYHPYAARTRERQSSGPRTERITNAFS